MKRYKVNKVLSLILSMCFIITGLPVKAETIMLDSKADEIKERMIIGTTYYVDDQNGSDSNTGTSPETAWKSLDKLNQTTFSAGDQLLFKRGGIWTGQLSPKGSGAFGNPIIIASYGEGARPLIQGNNLIENDDTHPENQQFNAAVFFYNQEYWEITELEVTNKDPNNWQEDHGKKYGILIMGHNAGTLRHMYCRDLYVHDVVSIPIGQEAGIGRGGIIYIIRGNQKKTSWDDIVVENNQVGPNINHYGINLLSTWGSSRNFESESGIPESEHSNERVNSTNIVIRNNYCIDVGNGAICPVAYENALIENNVCDTCNSGPNGNVPIWWESGDYTVAQNNEVFNSGASDSKEDSQAFDPDINAKLNYIQYNYTHDNPSGAFFECALYTPYTTHVRYNISENDGYGTNSHDQGSIITFANGMNGKMYVYNNTFYMSTDANGAPAQGYIIHEWASNEKVQNFEFKNNLIIDDGNSKGYGIGNDGKPLVTGVFSNNAYGGNNAAKIRPVTDSSSPLYREETNSLVYGEGISDPHFGLIDPGTGGSSGIDVSGMGEIKDIKQLTTGYKIKDNTSPLIGKGTLIEGNGGYDYWGNPVSSTGAPNIGADNSFADLNGGSGGGTNPDGNTGITFEDYSVEQGANQPLTGLYKHCNFGNGMWNVANSAEYGKELYANSLTNEQQVCKIAIPEGLILKGFKARSNNGATIRVDSGEEQKNFSVTNSKQEFQTGFQQANEAVYFIISSPIGTADVKLDDLILGEVEGGIKNVALNKPATANGESQNSPSLAVDDNESTLWIRNLYAGNAENHWLQVDLKKKYQLSEIETVFEKDTTGFTPWQYKIEGSNSEDFSNSVMLCDQTQTINTSKKQRFSVSESGTFRYIRITLTQLGGGDDPWPAIAELRVFADTGNYENAALNKPAEHSGQDPIYGHNASGANDGDKNTQGGNISITNNPYEWTVDFEKVRSIKKTELVFPPKGNDVSAENWIPNWKYKIDYSNDKTTWDNLVDYTAKPDSNPNKENLTQTEICDISCRYMRVTITGGPSEASGSWAVINEFSAFSPIESTEGADAAEPGQVVNYNLAYGKAVLSNDNKKEAGAITDNNAQTGWTPANNGTAQIDFGKVYNFNKIELQYENNSSAKQYKLFVSSDKENWLEILDQSSNTNKEAIQSKKLDTIGRYLKVEFIGESQKVMEVQAYGTEADREKRKIMIIVPHEDDEVLAGGGIIKDAALNGDDIKVVIGTNGDYSGIDKGKSRIGESIAALTNLNVKEKDMIFMGYADNGGLIGRWGQELDHSQLYQMYVTTDENKIIEGKNGTTQTYGQDTGGKQDYHFEYTGKHADYTRKNFLGDLMHAIEEFNPTDIYSTSMYDMHSDHAYINLFVREAILTLQKKDSSFQPTLWDGIVHSVAGDTDLGGDTRWPKHGQDVTIALEEPNYLEEATTFDWNKRVSVTVPYQMRQPAPLKYSLKEQTLRLYGSQYMDLFIGDFSRHDEVFWEKPFTSLSYQATVNASSNQEKAKSVIDGIESGYIKAMESLDFTASAQKKRNGFPDAEWVANGTTGEWIELQWTQPQKVKKIVLYDRPDPDESITSGKITFDDGTTKEVGSLPENGRPYEIVLESEKEIQSLKFEITGVSEGTTKPGLAEIEVYGETKTPEELNKQPLIDKIAQAERIKNEDGTYTAESFEALQKAIEEAKETLNKITTNAQVTEAVNKLQQAIDALVKAGETPEELNKQPLIDKIAQAEQIKNEDGTYTAESFESLQKAIEEAKKQLDTVTTNEQVTEAANKLQQAIDALVKVGETPKELNKQPLIDKIAQAEQIKNEDGTYTAESFESLQKAIEEAKKQLDTVTTNEQVTEAVNKLQKSVDALKKVQTNGGNQDSSGNQNSSTTTNKGEDKKEGVEENNTIIKDPVTGEQIGEVVTITQKDDKIGTVITTTIEKDENGKVIKGTTKVEAGVSAQEIEGRKASLVVALSEEQLLYTIEKGATNISIVIPKAEVIKQAKENNIKSISVNVVIPKTVAENKKATIQELILQKEVIEQSKQNTKNIVVSVQNEKGEEYYSWKFQGSELKNSDQIADTNLSMGVYPVKTQDYIHDIIKKENNRNSGLVFNFKHSGSLPAKADVKVYVGDQKNWKTGKKVYLYYYNDNKNKLIEQQKNQYKVDKQGYITINIEHCSDYVLLPAIPTGSNIISFFDKISVPKQVSIKKGETAVLKIKNKSQTDIKQKFSSNKTSIAKVNKNGKITAKKQGKAIITTKITTNGRTKTYKTNVKIKK